MTHDRFAVVVVASEKGMTDAQRAALAERERLAREEEERKKVGWSVGRAVTRSTTHSLTHSLGRSVVDRRASSQAAAEKLERKKREAEARLKAQAAEKAASAASDAPALSDEQKKAAADLLRTTLAAKAGTK